MSEQTEAAASITADTTDTTTGTTTTTVTLNEQVKVYWLLSKLPLSYLPHISTIITTTADTDMTVEKVKAKLT